MKKLASLVLAGAMAFSLAACGNNSTPAGGSSANAGTSTPAASTPASGGIEPIELTIYSPGNENSVPTKTIIEYARLVNEASDGAITLDVHHSNELGSDAESIESTRMGTIDLIFAGTSGFTSFYEKAKVLDLPFLFDSAEQAYEVTNSEIGEQIFSGLEEFGLVFLSEGDNGMRHISTTNRPVHTAADVQGLKIRVQDMKSQTDMMNYLGGIPVAMSYGDVYTSLQTGIIDGTENNETALTTGKHGEVCKVYSVDQHAMIPDVLIMSEKVWKQISPEDQQIILEAAHNSTEAHKVMWDTAIEEAVKEAQETMGVEFVYDVDKEAFREATQPMIEAYENEYPGVKTLMDTIEAAREGE